MVRLRRLAAGDHNQYYSGIFHNAVWLEIWERTLDKLVGFHDRLLFPEHLDHSAVKGEKLVKPQTSLVLPVIYVYSCYVNVSYRCCVLQCFLPL